MDDGNDDDVDGAVAPTGRETILHVDMDAFYASIEQRDRPELRGRPVVVGGLGDRGVVAAASYEARRYGVHSAMPITRARRRCPDLVEVAPDFRRYEAVSRAIREVFTSYTPLVETIALDEAFLDVAGSRRLFGAPVEIAHAVRADIMAAESLVASVGVATSKLCAKLASRRAKPDGVVCVPAGGELAFLHPLPVGDLWGVGPVTGERLDAIGVRTIGDLARVPASRLRARLGDAAAAHLAALAAGVDESPVVPDRAARSVSNETTFATDLTDVDEVRREIRRLAEKVASRLRDAVTAARTVTLTCRLPSFRTLRRSVTLDVPVASGPEIFDAAWRCWERLQPRPEAVRLLGVGASSLGSGDVARQLTFGIDGADAAGEVGGAADDGRWDAVMQAADEARRRFGDGSVIPARLVDPPSGSPDP